MTHSRTTQARKPKGRLGIVTLGVADVARARAFYEALGFVVGWAESDIVFFAGPGGMLALYPRDKLAEDARIPAQGSGFPGVALATNMASEAEADAYFAAAIAAGAQAAKPMQKAFWGGYSGYFTDLDGYLWEVAYNPCFPLDADGLPTFPDKPAS